MGRNKKDGRINYEDLLDLYNKCAEAETPPNYIVFSLENPPQFIVDETIADLEEDT